MRLHNKIEMFPSSIIANTFNFQREQFYQVPEEETGPVKVDLR